MTAKPSSMRVCATAVFALLLVSGGHQSEPAPVEIVPTLAEPVSTADFEWIDEKIVGLNPHLQPGQVGRIRDAILASSSRHGLDPSLVLAIMTVESTGRPHARSPKGALGLMQVMPYMIRPLDLAGNPSTIEANIEASCLILSSDIRRLGEDDGISTYFWGGHIRGTGYLDKVRAAQHSLALNVRS